MSRHVHLTTHNAQLTTYTALALFVAALAWRFLTFTGFTNDHYAHLALAQQVLLGDLPIRDFTDLGWPLQYLVSAAGWRLAGGAMLTEWAIAALAFAAGAAFTVMAAHRLSGSLAVAVLVTVTEIVISPRTYSYPKVLPYAAAAWAMVAATGPARRSSSEGGSPSHGRLALLGSIVAVAFLFRHDHGLYIGAATAAYTAFASYPDGIRHVARALLTLAAATLACLAPWLVYVAANGGIVEYFRIGLEYSRAEANATLLQAWPAFGLAPSLFSAANADAWLFWLFWSLPVACGGTAAWRALRGQQRAPVERTRRSPDRARLRGEVALPRARPGALAAVAALSVLALCANAGFLRHLLRTRLPDAIVPAVLLGAWALGQLWGCRGADLVRSPQGPAAQAIARAVALIVLLVSLLAIGSVANVPEQIDRISVARGAGPVLDRIQMVADLLGRPHRQTLAPPGRVSETLMPFYAYLDRCSSPADRLIVTGASPDVLVLAGRAFAGDGVVFASGYASASNQPRTLERLRADPALFVVVIDRDDFRGRYPLVDEYVTEEYEPMAVLSGTWPEDVPILVHRQRTAARTDPYTGWPCFFP